MVLSKEETLVLPEFTKSFDREIVLFNKALGLLESTITGARTRSSEYNKYAVLMLGGLNYKGFLSAFDRLSKGFNADSESILKRNIESFLSQAYLFIHPEKAELWCNEKIVLNDLEKNRHVLSKKLDDLNKIHKFFPTNMEDFFEDYIYRVFYTNANTLAHLDFDKVHREMGLENDPTKFATTMVLGPKFDHDYMLTTLRRILMLTMFQASLLKGMLGIGEVKNFTNIFAEVNSYFTESKNPLL